MKIVFHNRGVTLSPSALDTAIEKIQSALHDFDSNIVQVTAYLADINGPKGGRDKRAMLRVVLRGDAPVTVGVERSSARAALATATRKARRYVKRAIKKKQRYERLSMRESLMSAVETSG